ncbi:MAG: hypothetical protein PWR27_1215 [Petroclostridium sp.]|jgi:DeoR/GlpR family transcriptional regulator of sugar metabolism|uniref:DeoR/GlpR family DNA-binding transcription regulator n=1 Tax=Petroclostridium xylanilyticum TaxID=1792311 RepID=UPI000B996889|nr:DeoR/GlpR family DNA-binding transcription regulator [Petroclostridium xylanilyticum]MBZ4646430.1 transcriptional regulator [Clostridia bacterium]MDK2810506.1 hypothetical protein [Petroclostridium sp.]
MSNQRREFVLSLIKEKGEIRLSELKELFPTVSEMTLRRDLDYLEEAGLVCRTHGGAKILETPEKDEFEFSERIVTNIESKTLIAHHALKLLEPNRSIYLDAGSTLMAFAKLIPDINLYAITNAPNIGLEIMKRTNTEVIFLGGSLNKAAISVTGPFALNSLESLNIDIAFIATGGFSLENGFTNPYINECELKKKVIKIARKVIVMLDHSKINRNLPFTFAKLEDIDVLVTDKPLPQNILDEAKQKGIEVIY